MSSKTAVFQITLTSEGVSTDHEVEGNQCTIGRHPDNNLVLTHSQVSRYHLKIFIVDEKVIVTDLGSSNGTFLGKKQLPAKQNFELESSNELRLGTDGPALRVKLKQLAKPASIPNQELVVPKKKSKEVVREDSFLKLDPALPAAPLVKTEAPMTRQGANKEFEKILTDARKHASKIVADAEMQAEKKAQEAYQRMIETEQRAEKIFQDRMKDAHSEAEKFNKSAREETLALLQEARNKAKDIRDEAQSTARSLRDSTEKKCQEFISEAEKQGQELKNQRLAEADMIIEQQGIELLKNTREKIEKDLEEHHEKIKSEKILHAKKLEALNQEFKAIEDNYFKTEQELSKHHDEVRDLKLEIEQLQLDTKSRKDEIADLIIQQKDQQALLDVGRHEFNEQTAKLQAEIKKQTDSKSQVLLELEKLSVTVNALKQEKEQREHEAQRHLQALREKFEEEKARSFKEEQDRANNLKLEAMKSVKKLEKEMIEEILTKKAQMAKEILLELEATCSSLSIHKEWNGLKIEMNEKIQSVLAGSGQSLDRKNSAEQNMKKAISARSREKMFAGFMGFFLCALLTYGAYTLAPRFTQGASPLSRAVASAANAKNEDLKARKFNPTQVNEVKDSYVDAVIYTRGFAEKYNDAAYQEAWNKAATLYLLKTWRLEEDRSTRALAMSAALIKDLRERKDKIHPDFVKKGIAQMREIESSSVARLKAELGGEVRLESFKKFEKRFFEKYPQK